MLRHLWSDQLHDAAMQLLPKSRKMFKILFRSLLFCVAYATCGNASFLVESDSTAVTALTESVVEVANDTVVEVVGSAVDNVTAVTEASLQDPNGTLVEVEQGKLLGEYVLGSLDNQYYYSYKGIPYAKPPVGSLRFKDPQPAEAWDGVKIAQEHGSICPQVNMLLNVYFPGSEDCLFLNVYSPNITADPLLPVIVFIHGGVYKFGSGNVDNYGPDFLMTQGVVVVTINYRLDALGFLSLGTKDVPGNAALKDQVLALKWVQKNIEKFGGNSKNVTLMGESAGSAAVSMHLISPMSKGLFQRAICLSGVAFNDYSTARYPLRRTYALAKSLGCESKNTSEVLTFLQSVSYDKLINTTSRVLASEATTDFFVKLVPFLPMIESDVGQEDIFLSQDPMDALNSGNVNDVDLIIGYVESEASTLITYITTYLPAYYEFPEMFVPSSIVYTTTTDVVLEQSSKIIDYYLGNKSASLATMPEMVDFISNYTFVHDIHRFARKFSKYNNAYFYNFGISSTRNVYEKLLGGLFNISGAAHMDDLFYYFDAKSSGLTELTANTIEYDLVKMCTTLVANFATYGNPTPDCSMNFTWPTYDETNLSYLDLSNSPSVKTKADETDVQFWKGIFESAGVSW